MKDNLPHLSRLEQAAFCYCCLRLPVNGYRFSKEYLLILKSIFFL